MKGATNTESFAKTGARRFNPRAREGRDQSLGTPLCLRASVSIHAPVKGATQTIDDNVLRYCRFNPRAREGRD